MPAERDQVLARSAELPQPDTEMLANIMIEVGGTGEAGLLRDSLDGQGGVGQQFLDLLLADAVKGSFGALVAGFVEHAPQVACFLVAPTFYRPAMG